MFRAAIYHTLPLTRFFANPVKRLFHRLAPMPSELLPFTCVAFNNTDPPIRIGLLARDLAHAQETANEIFPHHRTVVSALPW